MPDVFDMVAAGGGGGDVFDEVARAKPPTDVFDQVAEGHGGDVFDAVGSSTPAQTAPSQAQPTWGDTAVTAGLRIGTPLLGSIIGSAVPAVGTALGGVGGGALGDVAAQAYERSRGLRPDYSLREAATSGVLGGLPGGSLTRSGVTAEQIAKEALRSAALGVGATAIGTEGSRGELPTAGEAATGAGLGIFGAALGSGYERYAHGKFGPVEAPPPQTSRPASNIPVLPEPAAVPKVPQERQLGMFGQPEAEGLPPSTGPQGDLAFPEEPLTPDPLNPGGIRGAIKNQIGRVFPESMYPSAAKGQEQFSVSQAEARKNIYGRAADQELQTAADAFDKRTPEQSLEWARTLSEKGPQGFADPQDQELAKLYRRASIPKGLALWHELPHKEIGFFENYVTPMFTDPEAAQKAFSREAAIGYPSFPSFTKTRSLDFNEMLDFARQNNLQLSTTNPFRWAQQRLGIEDRFLGNVDAMQKLRATNQVRPYDGDPRSLPLGIAVIDPRASMVLGKDQPFIAPEGLAKIINNKFAPDALGPYLRGASTLSSLVNQTRVAIDLYHGARSLVSDIGNNVGEALGLAAKGELSSAMKAAVAPMQTVHNYRRGLQAIKEFGQVGIQGETVSPAVEMAIRGGLTPEPELAMTWNRHFMEQMKDAQHSLPTNVARGVTSVLSAPVMRNIVPAIKMGAFQQGMEHFVKLNPNATEAELVAGAQSLRRNLDNVFGHISADNLGMSKTAANLLRVFIGFPSWNLGKVRLASDVVGGARNVLSNESLSADQSRALRFAGGTIITHMMAAALLNRALTGEWPSSPTDYFAPRTGGNLDDGNDERLYLPTVGTDAYKMFHNPAGTAGAKGNPLLATAYDVMVRNTDAMGIQIRDPRANGFIQSSQLAKYAGKQVTPFALQGFFGGNNQKPSSLGPVAATMGLVRAPASLSRDPAQQAMAEAQSQQLQSQGGITQEEFDRRQGRKDLRTSLRTNPGAGGLEAAIQSGLVNKREQKSFVKKANEDPFVSRTMTLDNVKDLIRVWKLASPEERAKLQPLLKKKLVRARIMGKTSDLQAYAEAGIR